MKASSRSEIRRIEGRALPLRGDDIDTDRIMPARFLRSITFDGLAEHLFEDDRQQRLGTPLSSRHPFSDPRFTGASILVVNRNFGCGSSREHAPQALYRWGIRAIAGESFSEIFIGNALLIGLPCVSLPKGDVEQLMTLVERAPETVVTVDVENLTVSSGSWSAHAALGAAHQRAFVTGAWDSTGMLLADYEQVHAVAERLPYIRGF